MTFRDSPPAERSIRGVARRLSKSPSLIGRWAGKYGWQIRAAAYDRELDRLWVGQVMRLRREVAERDVKLAGVMLGKVVQRLQTIDANSLSPRDCATWVDVATKVARLALGEPTDRRQYTHGEAATIDVDAMTPEERRIRLEHLLREGERRLKLVPPVADS